MAPTHTAFRAHAATALRWLRNAYFPEHPDDHWIPPQSSFARLMSAADRLIGLAIFTFCVAVAGWVIAAETSCPTGCDTGRIQLGAVIMTIFPIVTSAAFAVLTIMRALDGRRPGRWWIPACLIAVGWTFMGGWVMGTAYP